MNVLRDYQIDTVEAVKAEWKHTQSVCVVAPPGAGKTEIAMACVAPEKGKTLWVVHQTDLALQAEQRLRARFGNGAVGSIRGGHTSNPNAVVDVATVQSLTNHNNRAKLTGYDLCYLDECHHYAAEEWSSVCAVQEGGFDRILGGTATPQRADGKPLGDIFDSLVARISYSQLIADGYLITPRIATPGSYLHGDWAQNPLDAWSDYGQWNGICWLPSKAHARHYTEELELRRVDAASILDDTRRQDRRLTIERFEAGIVVMIFNVSTMLEGIDLPMCRCGMLARPFYTIGCYLQSTGRLLRPDPQGREKVVIDLTGAVARHGLPYQDRTYSLSGKDPISGGSKPVQRGEREDPQVLGIKLHDDFGDSRPDPKKLSEPDQGWLQEKRLRERKYRDLVARCGRDAADSAMRKSA